MTTVRRRFTVAALALLLLGMAPPAAEPFFPVAVWYSGGTARAPMVSPARARVAPREWRADLGAYQGARLQHRPHLGRMERRRTARRRLRARRSRPACCASPTRPGLRVIVQVYVDSAPEWVGREVPRRQLHRPERRHAAVAGGARILFRSPGRAHRRPRVLRGGGAPRIEQPGVLRLRRVERTGGDELGAAGVSAERAVLLLPAQPGAIP